MRINWDSDCIPRELMPQIDMADMEGLVVFLRAHGLVIEAVRTMGLSVVTMKQCLKDTHAATLTPELRQKPLIVSEDYKLVDGNGRYLAYKEEKTQYAPAIWVPTSFINTVLLMREYPKTYNLLGGIQPCRI